MAKWIKNNLNFIIPTLFYLVGLGSYIEEYGFTFSTLYIFELILGYIALTWLLNSMQKDRVRDLEESHKIIKSLMAELIEVRGKLEESEKDNNESI